MSFKTHAGKLYSKFALLLCVSFVINACKAPSDKSIDTSNPIPISPVSPTTPSQPIIGTGWLKILVSPLSVSKGASQGLSKPKDNDHKQPPSLEWQQIILNVVEVSVKQEDTPWKVVNSNNLTLELISLSQNASAILADTRLEPGTYTKIRLRLEGDATGIDMSGNQHKIDFPSGATAGIQLKGSFVVQNNGITSIALNFDPDESVKTIGNNRYRLVPKIYIDGVDVDVVAPIVNIVNPISGATKNSNIPIRIEYADASIDLNSLSIIIDGTESKSSFGIFDNYAEANLSFQDGEHTITTSISDTALNVGTANVTFKVDTAVPLITLASTNIVSRIPNPLIQATITDVGTGILQSSLQVLIDNQNVTQQFIYQNGQLGGSPILSEGNHSLLIRVSDIAGNTSEQNGNIITDFSSPSISFSPLAGTVLATRRPDLIVSITDSISGVNVSTIRLLINDIDKTSEFTVSSTGIQGAPGSDLNIGENIFRVLVTDNAGNESSLSTKLILGVSAPVLTVNPENGAIITSRQPSIFVGFSGSLLNLSSFKFLLNNVDISSQFILNNTGATLFATGALSLGTNTIVATLENSVGQIQSLNSNFTVIMPPPEPNPAPLPPPTPISDTETIPFDETRSVAIEDKNSPAYGAVAIIPKGAIDDDIELKIEIVDPGIVQNTENIQEPGSMGPVLKFEPSMEFNTSVTVGVPFDLAAYQANNLNPKDLIVIRQDSETHEFEVLVPFSIDFEKGIMYIQTTEFSLFWGGYYGGYNPDYVDVSFTSPTQIISTGTSNKYSEVRQQQIQLVGRVLSNLIASNPALITCIRCPSGTTINSTQDPNNNFIVNFNINFTLPTQLQEVELDFKVSNIQKKEVILFNVLPPFPIIPPVEIPICDQTGKLCNHAGNGSLGFSADGVDAKTSPISVNTEGNELFDISHDSQGRVVWLEPTNRYIMCNGPNVELAIRRVGFTNKLETITKFTLSSVNGGIMCGQQNQDLEINIAAQDDYIFLPISSQEFVGAFGQEKFFHRLFKIGADGSASVLPVTINFGTTLAPASNGILYIKTTGTQGNGIYRFNLTNNQLTFLGGTTASTISPDGTNITNFEVTKIKDIAFYNNELYFTQPSANCIRKFDANWNVKTVGGICNSTLSTSGENVNALTAHLGQVSQLEVDSQGNIFFSENVPVKRFRAIRKDNGNVVTISGGGLQPLSISNMPVDATQVTIPNDQLYYDAFTVDTNGNFFGLGNNFIYRVAQPVPLIQINNPSASNPVAAPATVVTHVNTALTADNLEKILNNSQNPDGYWDFDEKYSGDVSISDDSIRRLMATEKALELYKAIGKEDSPIVERALNWISNQEYESTSLIAKQLKTLTNFKLNPAVSESLRSGRQRLLLMLGERYRPSFFGWGSDQYSLTDNLDTSEVLSALTSANNIYNPNAGAFVTMSDYQSVIIKILSKQFNTQYGVNLEGGWGFTGREHFPTALVTTNVCEALIDYAALSENDAHIINPLKRNEFLNLKSTQIPNALKKALPFLLKLQRVDGSFGSVAETVKVTGLFAKAKKSGLITDSTLLASLDSSTSSSVNFLNNVSLSTLDLGELALMTDHFSSLNRSIAAAEDIIPESIIPPTDPQLGTAKDGALLISGIFNLNENASGNRKRPDGVALKVSNIMSNTTLEVDNFVNGDLAINDEIILFNEQGTLSVGSFEFAKVIGIDTISNPVRLTLQSALTQNYSVDGHVILQRVPHYSQITPTKSLVITSRLWNGESGGLVALRVAGSISSLVSIQTSGLGFRGGQSQVDTSNQTSQQGEGISGVGGTSGASMGANGCGGGNASLTDNFAGGGGSYGSAGEPMSGFTNSAINGFIFGTSQINKIYLGCGGGSGVGNVSSALSVGGSGGGVVVLFANSYNITGLTNYLRADGSAGTDAVGSSLQQFGSGGGSGGTILLNVKNLTLGANAISAIGGNGSEGVGINPGFKGGAGRIRINYSILNGVNYPSAGSNENAIHQTVPASFGGQF